MRISLLLLSSATCFQQVASFLTVSSLQEVGNGHGVALFASRRMMILPESCAMRTIVASIDCDFDSETNLVSSDRRSMMSAIGFFVASELVTLPAYASGGATAGGAYLLSAKQRYNKRVTAGIKSFLTLDARDLSQVEAFFASSEEGGWEDLSSAGYLLANAFRTSSTKAPDNLPSVKKWKAFSKDIDLLQRALSKKDGEKVFSYYKSAEEKLEAYLEAVELPSAMELKQM